MVDWVKLWVIAAVVFLALDMVWLVWLGRHFYVDEIGTLLREQPGLLAAGLFYVLYIAGLVLFVIHPAHLQSSLAHAALYGAAFGLVAYGTYDLTSLAVLKGFTAKIAAIDMIWGTVLTSATATLTVWVAKLLGKA